MKKVILLLVLVALSLQTARIIGDAGILRSVDNTVDFVSCEKISGPVGAEDITIDANAKVAYISADDRRVGFNDPELGPYPDGGLWRLDLSKPNSVPEKLDVALEGAFHPHGIALRFASTGTGEEQKAVELYVVNHLSHSEHEILVFTVAESGELNLRKRVSYPELISPNDLVVVGKDQFFVSNDHGYTGGSFMTALEDYLGLPLASISYFDGQNGHIVVSGLRYTNGLAVSADNESLFVAETTAGTVSRYVKTQEPNGWELDERLDVDMGVDNFEWDGSGYLLNAGHPKLFDFQAHAKDETSLSASQVVRIDVNAKPMTYETIYLNQGEEISGASVAATLDQIVLVGSVFEPHFLRCQR